MTYAFTKKIEPQHRRAFSMLEVTLSTVIVSLVLVSALNMSASSLLMWNESSSDTRAQTLAHDLLNEILAVSYEDPETDPPDWGTESDEPWAPDRLIFDDTDDYDGWHGVPPARRNGSEIPNLIGWDRHVSVEKVEANDPTWTLGNGQADQGVRLITITVSDSTGGQYILKAIVSKLGGVERATGVDTSFVSGAHLELSTTSGDVIVSGTDLNNHADGP